MRKIAIAAALSVALVATDSAHRSIVLPNGWIVQAPPGAMAVTGTMPQGMSVSPDAATIAVVESGYNKPTLSLYRAADLTRVASIDLPGAFGRPVWLDVQHVLVAGANADALLDVDVMAGRVVPIGLGKKSYPVHVALSADRATAAVATDGDAAVRIGSPAQIAAAAPITIGAHPSGVAFDAAGDVFVSLQGGDALIKIAAGSRAVTRQTTGLHPSDVAVLGSKVFVAQSDAGSVAVYDAATLQLTKTIPVGLSPNSVTVSGDRALVTLGAGNSVAVLQNDSVAARSAAGWYPTDALAIGQTLYVLDGKGEGARPNPQFTGGHSDADYIGAIEFGSLRAYDLTTVAGSAGSAAGAPGWNRASGGALVRPGGPIEHVFFVLKENRTYDQVLGDLPSADGDPALTWFGRRVTPNQHAIAERFGVFDNTYASGEVSAAGHMWADASLANDYVERWWPPIYGERREDDVSDGGTMREPAGGYLWDAASRAHVSFRDYGEQVSRGFHGSWIAAVPSLRGRLDPQYAGWDLDYSDLDRVKEWQSEFAHFVSSGTLPQLEFIWLPNDHTYGAKPGKLTPSAYVATNDYALGKMVQTLSHSRVWKSSAMFVIEDDAQNGPDHVSDQRTTFYLISPYARGGVMHEHYATVGVLRTIEMLLGMRPLSAYDAMAVPLAAAFGRPDMRPYAAIAPQIDMRQRNAAVAYGAATSARADFRRPDAVSAGALNDILAHNLQR